MTEPRPPERMRFVFAAKLRSYLVQHDAAIRLLDEGLGVHPADPVLLRHRGEFLLTVRRYEEATRDLEAAAAALEALPDQVDPYQAQLVPEIERLLLATEPVEVADPPPVTPGAIAALAGSYAGTLKASVWYHLALARYLTMDFGRAAADFIVALGHGALPDSRAAAVNWGYLALRHAGDDAGARALLDEHPEDTSTAEPSYARNLSVFRGVRAPEPPSAGPLRSRVTQAYAVGAFLWLEGDAPRAREVFESVVAAGDPTSFGHLAAAEALAGWRWP